MITGNISINVSTKSPNDVKMIEITNTRKIIIENNTTNEKISVDIDLETLASPNIAMPTQMKLNIIKMYSMNINNPAIIIHNHNQ
jgi:hypothetical protein